MNRKLLKRAFVSLEYVLISSILVVGMIFVFKTTQQDSSQVVGVGVDNVNRVLHLGADRPHLESIKDKQQDIFEIQVDREVEDPSGTKTMTEKIQEFFENLLSKFGNSSGGSGSGDVNIQQNEYGFYFEAPYVYVGTTNVDISIVFHENKTATILDETNHLEYNTVGDKPFLYFENKAVEGEWNDSYVFTENGRILNIYYEDGDFFIGPFEINGIKDSQGSTSEENNGPEIGEYVVYGKHDYLGHRPNVNEVIGFWDDEVTISQNLYFPADTMKLENKKITIDNVVTFTFSEDGTKATGSNGVQYEIGNPYDGWLEEQTKTEFGFYDYIYYGSIGDEYYSFAFDIETGKIELNYSRTISTSDISISENQVYANDDFIGTYDKETQTFTTVEGFQLEYVGAGEM